MSFFFSFFLLSFPTSPKITHPLESTLLFQTNPFLTGSSCPPPFNLLTKFLLRLFRQTSHREYFESVNPSTVATYAATLSRLIYFLIQLSSTSPPALKANLALHTVTKDCFDTLATAIRDHVETLRARNELSNFISEQVCEDNTAGTSLPLYTTPKSFRYSGILPEDCPTTSNEYTGNHEDRTRIKADTYKEDALSPLFSLYISMILLLTFSTFQTDQMLPLFHEALFSLFSAVTPDYNVPFYTDPVGCFHIILHLRNKSFVHQPHTFLSPTQLPPHLAHTFYAARVCMFRQAALQDSNDVPPLRPVLSSIYA